jgi:hypothetical protein
MGWDELTQENINYRIYEFFLNNNNCNLVITVHVRISIKDFIDHTTESLFLQRIHLLADTCSSLGAPNSLKFVNKMNMLSKQHPWTWSLSPTTESHLVVLFHLILTFHLVHGNDFLLDFSGCLLHFLHDTRHDSLLDKPKGCRYIFRVREERRLIQNIWRCHRGCGSFIYMLRPNLKPSYRRGQKIMSLTVHEEIRNLRLEFVRSYKMILW